MRPMIWMRTLATTGLAIAALGVATVAQAVPESFTQASAIDVDDAGEGEVSGSVSTDHEVFQFEASEGEVITLDVNVTEVLSGAEYEDNDSQLFLFDQDGRLIAENDDESESSFESLISDFVVPSDGTYFVVVTTWDNDPVLDEDGLVVEWGSNGSSSIEYNLLLSKKSAASE